MKMTELGFDGAQPPIDGYAPGGFRVAGRFHEGALLLAPDGLRPWLADRAAEAPPLGLGALDAAAAAAIAALGDRIDLVVLGLGANLAPAPAAFRAAVEAAGVALEPMATPTACRAYNVLLSEGRRVAAALLPV